MVMMSAADYAASEPAKQAYAAAMAYQAANPQHSSSRPSAASANGAYVPTATPKTFAPMAGVTTAAGANPNASTTESIFRDANGKVTGLRRANGDIVYTGQVDPNELADFESRLGGGGTPENVQQAPQTAIPSQSMPVQNGLNGNASSLPGQYTGLPVTSTANPVNGNENAQSYINSIAAAQQSAAIAALGKSRDTAMSNLGAEKTAIAPKFTQARSQVATGAQQAARNFAEFMANRGGASGGVSAQAQLSNSAAMQSNMGALGRDETAAYTDIGRRTTDVGNAYESDVASTTAAAEGEKMKLLLQDYYTAQQRGDTLAQQSIQNKIAEAQMQVQQAQLRMQEKGQIQAQSNADRTFTSGENQNTFTNNLATDAVAYKKQQDAENKVIAAAEAAEKQKQNNIALAQWGVQTFGYGEAKADAGVFFEQYAGVKPIVAQKLAAEVAQMGFDTAIKQALAENTITKTQADMIIDQAQVKIQQQNANTSAASAANSAASASRSASNQEKAQDLAQAKFDYDKDPTNPDNILKLAQAQKAANPEAEKPTESAKKNQINAQIVSVLDGMQPQGMKDFFSNEKQNLIKDLGIEGYERLYGMYQNKFRGLK